MTNDLAKTIAAACLEAIQSRPDTPTEDELADVVRPLLADHEDEKYRIARETAYRIAQEQMQQAPEWMRDAKKRAWATMIGTAVWPLANDVEPTKGKWLCGNWVPDAPPKTPEVGDA